jgi:hypothetical protein
MPGPVVLGSVSSQREVLDVATVNAIVQTEEYTEAYLRKNRGAQPRGECDSAKHLGWALHIGWLTEKCEN